MHKRTHTVVVVNQAGRKLGQPPTTTTTTADHLGLLSWAKQLDEKRVWAVEDCRHLSPRAMCARLPAEAAVITPTVD